MASWRSFQFFRSGVINRISTQYNGISSYQIPKRRSWVDRVFITIWRENKWLKYNRKIAHEFILKVHLGLFTRGIQWCLASISTLCSAAWYAVWSRQIVVGDSSGKRAHSLSPDCFIRRRISFSCMSSKLITALRSNFFVYVSGEISRWSSKFASISGRFMFLRVCDSDPASRSTLYWSRYEHELSSSRAPIKLSNSMVYCRIESVESNSGQVRFDSIRWKPYSYEIAMGNISLRL